MLDGKEQNARSRYQNVVEAVADARAWGLEWFLNCSRAKDSDANADAARKKCDQLSANLRNARTMMETGVLSEFFGSVEEIPVDLATPRTQLIEALDETLHVIEGFNAAHDKADQGDLRVAAERHSNVVGASVKDFLRALNAFVATSESEENGRNASLISGALQEIGKINETINLIAVNASVEAARAGEAGRGFSVIASEIQSLSHKSADVFRDLKTRLR